ncbi:MAG: 2Fe-2S iron-sulfur cluster binding domain-containing protein [Saprospiraceae bacterium]|nr:2Fe-2S iron-sulfur cluster binding domain-containing protein [Saprospiraceae bacterium]
MEFYKVNVAEVIKETPDAISIGFETEALKEIFDHFIPGQHLTLKLNINNKEVRRSYSISSIPHEPQLRITVKQVKKGLVSNHLVEKIDKGSVLEISKPEGHFTITPDPEKSHSYYFFAAGSGITPVLSMIRSLLEHEPKSTVHLLYGNRKEDNIIFYEKLKSLQTKYEGQFFAEFTLSQSGKGLLPFFSSSKDHWTGWKGRINKKLINTFCEKYPSRTKEKSFYICGPGNMIEDVKKELTALGNDPKTIHAEYFSTPATTAGDSKAAFVSSANITFHLNGQQHQLQIPGNKKILDSLMDAGFDPPYSCCSGACSTCMAKIIKGSVHMDVALALEQDEIAAGYILTCQSRPTSEELEIKY